MAPLDDPTPPRARGGAEALPSGLDALLPIVDVPAGPWVPPDRPPFDGAVGVLVVKGLLLHDLQLDRGGATELLGPGDLLQLQRGRDELLPFATSFLAAEDVRLAVLDDRLPEVLARWPEVGARIIASSAARHRRQALHRVASQLPRVEERLLALYWLIAEQWGRMGPEGVVISLSLTHELLGRLVGARRPTVTMAVGSLVDAGHLRRRPDRSVVLAPESRRLLTPQPGRLSRMIDIAVLEGATGHDARSPLATVPARVPVTLTVAERAERTRDRAVVLRHEQRRAVERAQATVLRSEELLARMRDRRASGR